MSHDPFVSRPVVPDQLHSQLSTAEQFKVVHCSAKICTCICFTMSRTNLFPSLLPLLLLLPPLLTLPCTSESQALDHAEDEPMLQSTSMDAGEKETLFRVMESMSSDRDWRSSNPDPCTPGSSWPGIECTPGTDDGRLHVTRLDFGAAPNPTCKNESTFPSEVLDLPCLRALFFLNCFRSTETNLSLPPPSHKAAAYTSLQRLSLMSNPSLVGDIPPHISSLTSLQVLTLSQNHLSGQIPESVSGMSSLVHLDLSYNNLKGSIPSQIGGLRSLRGLDLSYNSLTGTIPPSIGDLNLLQKLDLSSNSLTGSMPESLVGLNLLDFLALSNNNLSGGFPRDMDKLQNLQYLIMDNNPMFLPLPPGLGGLVKLQELRLANSGYSGTIPESFASLTNLTTLSLENNMLTGQIPAGLSGLSRIYHLNLSKNMLTGVVPFDAGFLKRLRKNLDLSGNSGLCINGSSESYVNIGVDACGDEDSSPQNPLASSGAASPSLKCYFYRHLMYLFYFAGHCSTCFYFCCSLFFS